MKVSPIYSNVSFGYSSPLKTLYKKGKLPVKYDFYGSKLTNKNVTLEHLKPHSQGGKTNLKNLVLATKENNQLRADKDIKEFLDMQNVKRYLSYFQGLKFKDFDGDRYIRGIWETIKELTK